jgi:hypothetical protein
MNDRHDGDGRGAREIVDAVRDLADDLGWQWEARDDERNR